MDFQHFLDIIFGTVLTGLTGFGAWVVRQLNDKPTKAEVRELIHDKQEANIIYIQELKEDIRRIELKLDKLIEKK